MLYVCNKHNHVSLTCQEKFSDGLPYVLKSRENLSIKTIEPQAAGSLRLSSAAQSGLYGFVDKSEYLQQSVLGFLGKVENEKVRPILENKADDLWKDEKSVPVAGKKCSCKSVWCPTCFKYLYKERIKQIFLPFDWQKTRQVVLTINPELFPSPVEALEYIREKHAVGEFIRRLRHGVKTKSGRRWVWKYEPVKISRWAWFMEFHKNGFPHFHVFIETEYGKSGMIGGDFLRDTWKLAEWVKETYFQSEQHFRNLTGYYADKGYFEKGKKYQGLLPDVIMDNFKTKIKRMNSSERNKREKIKIEDSNIGELMTTPFDDAGFRECIEYFDEQKGRPNVTREEFREVEKDICEKINQCENKEEKRQINYRVMIAGCGQYTYIELDIKEYRIGAVCKLDYQKWKKKAGGLFYNNRGYVVNLTKKEIVELLESVERITSIKKYIEVKEYTRKRSNFLEQVRLYQENMARLRMQ